MLEAGLDLDGELLALACASHSGEPFHVDGVRRILAAAGLTEDDLQTPPDWPVDEDGQARRGRALAASAGAAADELLRQARRDARHLRRQRLADRRPTSTRAIPLQRHLLGTVERLAGEPVAATGVDGCGAPLFALSPGRPGPVRSRRSPPPPTGTPEHRVAVGDPHAPRRGSAAPGVT